MAYARVILWTPDENCYHLGQRTPFGGTITLCPKARGAMTVNMFVNRLGVDNETLPEHLEGLHLCAACAELFEQRTGRGDAPESFLATCDVRGEA